MSDNKLKRMSTSFDDATHAALLAARALLCKRLGRNVSLNETIKKAVHELHASETAIAE